MFKVEIYGIEWDSILNFVCEGINFSAMYIKPIDVYLELKKDLKLKNIKIICSQQISHIEQKYNFQSLRYYCTKCKNL